MAYNPAAQTIRTPPRSKFRPIGVLIVPVATNGLTTIGIGGESFPVTFDGVDSLPLLNTLAADVEANANLSLRAIAVNGDNPELWIFPVTDKTGQFPATGYMDVPDSLDIALTVDNGITWTMDNLTDIKVPPNATDGVIGCRIVVTNTMLTAGKVNLQAVVRGHGGYIFKFMRGDQELTPTGGAVHYDGPSTGGSGILDVILGDPGQLQADDEVTIIWYPVTA